MTWPSAVRPATSSLINCEVKEKTAVGVSARLGPVFPLFFPFRGFFSMLQYMKAFLAEEERRKQLGLPSQVPRNDNEVAMSTEEESSDEEPPRKSAKTSSTFQAINSASMSKRPAVYVAPHGLPSAPPYSAHDILALTS